MWQDLAGMLAPSGKPDEIRECARWSVCTDWDQALIGSIKQSPICQDTKIAACEVSFTPCQKPIV